MVVEAAMKGGALITAEIANSYHKDVFAFPGRTTDLFSEGCNFLIKTNRAALIHHPKDLAYYMGWEALKQAPQTPQLQLPINLNLSEQQIVAALQVQPLNIDSLSSEIKVTQSTLAMLLLNLEMQGVIRVLPGKRYQLCS
ncbi:DNA protecting protein DprA [compost metagenome]